MAFHAPTVESTVHFLVYAHRIPLEDFDEFEGDDHADGDISAVQNEVRAEGNTRNSAAVGIWLLAEVVFIETSLLARNEAEKGANT